MTLCYRAWRDGTAIGRDNCDLYAWHGDAQLVPHLWRVLGAPGVEIEVGIAAPVLSWAVADRKQLGAELQRTVGQQLDSLRQRGMITAPAEGAAAAQHA